MREYPRKARLNTQVQAEVAQMIRAVLSDPRVKGATVTEADVSPDLHQAKISISHLGTDAELKAAVDGLNHAAGKLRHELGTRLKLRVVPNLRFVADTRMREADHLNRLIRAAVTDDEQHRPKT